MGIRRRLAPRDLPLRTARWGACLAVAAVGMTACGGGGGQRDDERGNRDLAPAGGAITVAVTEDPGSLDPHHAVTSAAAREEKGAVKRNAALASLSRDHHQALVVAQRLARASGADALAGGGDLPLDAIHEVGARLAAHVRLEERELFPMIERAMPPTDLLAVARKLERLELSADFS